ncbi:glucose-6-phosphate/phosphate translocator 2, chloroplastic isoform X2 [Physcomitrium patens]|uniref:Sugar phosphate transporter domain-containing protein n=1 Tax=Physcomitrium patens TaxID=3218 RepID=A0A2K1KMX0_PHYPA|nr:glucose-6-phosphate/phosphate translocator 2, chloroplastic-like isoform X2 [Physcomitrium patens]PNR55111.1 hypothetical protein PHYPA_006004 [Physcomitrium patens]|eukprot:XP_024374417.1 glucose-6-phosphate/phosphate translocator 2, chloroplastic-like isoform X2 [Physcomitrella patens]
MMAMRSLPGLASSGLEHLSCPGSPSRSAISRSQYGIPPSQFSRVRSVANSTPLKTTLSVSKLNFNPFLAGESLGVSSSTKVGPAMKKALVHRVSAQAGDASSSDAYPEGTPKVGDVEVPKPAMRRVKIGIYFATWWALNVVFNIYNKKVLNVFPFPWLTSTLSLAAGSAIMLISWALRIVPAPDVDVEFWKGLAPAALAHTIGHVAATVSMSKVAVSFTHIIKSAEPAFSVIIQRLLLGEDFPLPVYLSLLPIVGGCGLAAATELNFNMTGFVGAMVSNIAFVFRNIFSKKGMTSGKSVGGMNYYACLSMMSLVFLTPFAIAVEGPKSWTAGWDAANLTVGPKIFWWVVAQSVFYHLYNQVSYMSLNEISPLTFSIGNTMKRVTVIVSSIIIFHTQVQPMNAVGAAIAIFGTFLYSQANQ